MDRPLDGIALDAYCRRLGFCREVRDLLTGIRSSPPNRSPRTRHGNVAVWYPSTKMGCTIKAESAKVEFAFLLEAEHDDAVLEFYDQPPPIILEYHDAHGRLQRPLHTADYFVFRAEAAGWEECKPSDELQRQACARPNRYCQGADGLWQCPPGEAFATQYGLGYRVRASDQINWVAQSNWLFLEDYYQDLHDLRIPADDAATLCRLVEAHPGLTLANLRRAAPTISADAIYTAIAQHLLNVDLTADRLAEPTHTRVFPARHRACTDGTGCAPRGTPVVRPAEVLVGWDGQGGERTRSERTDGAAARSPIAVPGCGPASGGERAGLTPEGRVLLDRARAIDVATAVWRDRVIHPEQYEDEEQAQNSAARAAIPERTKRLWRHAYRMAEKHYGSGFLGLLPRFTDRGGTRKLAPTTLALIHEVLTSHYDTTAQAPRRGAYGEYVRRAAEQHLAPVSQRTFYREAHRHRAAYDQALVREGKRAAYALKDYVWPREPTVSRHGDYAWAMAHLDHTEVDLELRDARTGVPLGRCWLTLLILAPSRRIAACYLSFDPPSYRSCMMVLRLCVKRHGRLPTAVTVDGGPEFRSVYFEQLLALYRVRKHQRPAAEPRFGSVVERLFGTLNTQLVHHLLGNTQASTRPRLLTAESDPRSQSVWTLAAFAERVQHWADQEYDSLPHPALGQSPREAYAQSLARDGERQHKRIAYDQDLILATLPTTRRGAALVQPGRGVRMHYLDYWCEEMRDPVVERMRVPVRFDPFDVSVGYAYIGGRWRCCQCACDALAGCSERELQILAEEVRMRNRLLHGREHLEITQQQLAAFRRETAAQESVLRQQRRDGEAKAAFTVLEGGLSREAQTVAGGREAAPPADPAGAADEPLLVLRRYRP